LSGHAPLRLGLVGCGRLAEMGYVPALESIDGVELVAVVDPDEVRRAAIATKAGGEVAEFVGAADLAAANAVDGAIVATPVQAHLADATSLVSAGVQCLIEKPPAPDAVGAEALAALTPAAWVGFNRRFTHGGRLRDAIPAAGPLELQLELRYRRASWDAVAVGDPAILDLAPHLVDLALWLTGAEEARVRSAHLSADEAELELELERGTARISCATNRAHRERVEVRANGRTVATSSEGGPLALFTTRLPGRVHPLVESLRAQVEAFARAVRGDDPGPLANAADGARTMRVIDAAREVAA
jgi:predicted dehydrogenase